MTPNKSMTLELVKDYYGKILQSSKDLKTTACCVAEKLPTNLQAINAKIHEDVRSRFYGCGVCVPQDVTDLTVLDMGCGSGRDVYLLSALVGERGKVIGVDMTQEQLAVASKHQEFHQKAFGQKNSNVEFRTGYFEDLESCGIATGSVDLVVANCTFNLSPDKGRVFREIFRVLKPGGELYFSDVFCDRRLPASCSEDPVLLGECLGGAMYIEDFRRQLLKIGINDTRIVKRAPIEITDPEVQAKTHGANFSSLTIRVFNINIEDRCEDYGQVAYYLGTIAESQQFFLLDDHHLFEKNRPMTVCSNTAAMLTETRLKKHFRVEGNLSTHFGLFDCGPVATATAAGSAAACC